MTRPDPAQYAPTTSLTTAALKSKLELSWSTPERTSIEKLILDAVPREWEDTLCILVKAEWDLRLKDGEIPTAEEYLRRFPTSKQLVKFLPMLVEARPEQAPSLEKTLDVSLPAGGHLPPTLDVPRDVLSEELQAYLDAPQQQGELGRLGPYILRRVLGQGGMGAVFAATDPTLNREVAVKLLNPHIANVPVARERFIREARMMASLLHDNIVPLYDICDVQDRTKPLYYVMPLLQGETLETKLGRERQLAIPAVVQVLREVAAGLALAHELHIVHRDIKPANLWVETLPEHLARGHPTGYRIRILDFGLARELESPSLTKTGFYIGTPGYSAPEQIESRPLDGRADLFSLGCVAYQCAAGVRPFRGLNVTAVVKAVMLDKPKLLTEVVPGFPLSLAKIIDYLLKKKPDRRIPTAQELLRLLDAFEAQPTSQSIFPTTADQSGIGLPPPKPFPQAVLPEIAPAAVPLPPLDDLPKPGSKGGSDPRFASDIIEVPQTGAQPMLVTLMICVLVLLLALGIYFGPTLLQ